MGLTASSQCGEASSLAFPTLDMPFPNCQNKREKQKKKRISNGEPFITEQYYLTMHQIDQNFTLAALVVALDQRERADSGFSMLKNEIELRFSSANSSSFHL